MENTSTPAKLVVLVENVVQAALQGIVSCKGLMLTPKLAYRPAAVIDWLVMPLMVTFIWVQ